MILLVTALGFISLLATSALGCDKSGPPGKTTDHSTTAAVDSTLQGLVKDGQWELRVDLQARTTGDVKAQKELLPDSAYTPVDVALTFQVLISEGGAKVSIEADQGNYRREGTRKSIVGGRIWYDTEGYWGGRFVIWRTADGLQAEETMYGEGHPILHSYRGPLVRVPAPSSSAGS